MRKSFIVIILAGFSLYMICSCGKKEEPVAEEETTVAEEKTEEAKPAEPVKVEKSEPVEDEPEDYTWAKEYLDIINDWHMNHTGDQAEGYSLIYLNDDDIPELVLNCSYDVGGGTDLYTIIDDKATKIKVYDFDDEINTLEYSFSGVIADQYAERKGIYFWGGEVGGGYYSEAAYFLNGDNLEQVYFQEHSLTETIFENDDEVGEKWNYKVRIKKQDGTVLYDKTEPVEINYSNSDVDPREDFGDSNTYYGEFKKEYGFDSEDLKYVSDDNIYSFNEITEELKKLLPEGAVDESDYSWGSSYLEYLKQFSESTEEDGFDGPELRTYNLIYVDEDNIPELLLMGNCEAIGNLILTCHNGQIDELQTSRLAFDYLENENKLRNDSGNMGFYYDYIYSIDDGKWTLKKSGEYYVEDNTAEWDWDDLIYKWEGNIVSKADYERELRNFYDVENAKEGKGIYSYEEILKELNKFQAETTFDTKETSEPWKATYRKILTEILNGSCTPPYDVSFGNSFVLRDLNEDDIPELLVKTSGDNLWILYDQNSDSAEYGLVLVKYFIPETGEIVTIDDMYALGEMLTVHYYDGKSITGGFDVCDATPDMDGYIAETIFKIFYADGEEKNITKEEAYSLCEQYNHPEKYPMGSEIEINSENIEDLQYSH